jgi:hypothetical protein
MAVSVLARMNPLRLDVGANNVTPPDSDVPTVFDGKLNVGDPNAPVGPVGPLTPVAPV